MVTARNYIDNAPAMVLTGSINGTATTCTVVSAISQPVTPFNATLDRGLATAEQVRVTNITGSTVTITRNINGLGAYSHSSGAMLEHSATSQDYSEANAHLVATTGVHGLTGAVVGTSDTQTLTNKTLVGAVVGATTVTASGNVAGATFSGVGVAQPGMVVMSAAVTSSVTPTPAIPTGWLLCDGTAVSRATYSALFTAIGTAFGVGDGSTTFNVPRLTDRFPQGPETVNSGQIGTSGGNAGHSHTLSSAGHANITLGASVYEQTVATTGAGNYDHRADGTGFTTTLTSGPLTSGTTLGGSTDSNTDTRPPYTSLAFLIKT